MNNNQVVDYAVSTDKGYSASIWKGSPSIPHGTLRDQVHVAEFSPSTVSSFVVVADASCGAGAIPLEDSCVFVGASDNDEAYVHSNADIFAISDNSGMQKPLWYEAIFSTDSITDCSIHMGLGRARGTGGFNIPLATAQAIVNDSGALISTADFIGFRTLTATPTILTFTYLESGSTVQNLFTVQTLAVNTQYKVGFVYDPTGPAAKRIKIYLNGAEQTTYVTATLIAASTWPDAASPGIGLSLVNAVKTGTTAAVTLKVKSKCVQSA